MGSKKDSGRICQQADLELNSSIENCWMSPPNETIVWTVLTDNEKSSNLSRIFCHSQWESRANVSRRLKVRDSSNDRILDHRRASLEPCRSLLSPPTRSHTRSQSVWCTESGIWIDYYCTDGLGYKMILARLDMKFLITLHFHATCDLVLVYFDSDLDSVG